MNQNIEQLLFKKTLLMQPVFLLTFQTSYR